jgi:hypothetical protein
MLVHPKRQESIQSLRRHLQRHTSLSQVRKPNDTSAREPRTHDEDTEDDHFSLRRGAVRDTVFMVEAKCEEKGQDSK